MLLFYSIDRFHLLVELFIVVLHLIVALLLSFFCNSPYFGMNYLFLITFHMRCTNVLSPSPQQGTSTFKLGFSVVEEAFGISILTGQ